MRRVLSTRSGAGQTHVGAVSPRITDQRHNKATGGEALEDAPLKVFSCGSDDSVAFIKDQGDDALNRASTRTDPR
jgi:hypothetical protein